VESSFGEKKKGSKPKKNYGKGKGTLEGRGVSGEELGGGEKGGTW